MEDLWAWQIDFILAYPQADIETEIYLDLPIGYEEFLDPNERREDCVLLLKKNVYGLKQAGRTWFQHL
jgi:Reverse transcriptase (RNA-dependent DNA polymerase)